MIPEGFLVELPHPPSLSEKRKVQVRGSYLSLMFTIFTSSVEVINDSQYVFLDRKIHVVIQDPLQTWRIDGIYNRSIREINLIYNITTPKKSETEKTGGLPC